MPPGPSSTAAGSAVAPLLVTTSWDDGHPSDARIADLLDKHGMHGTFFVPCRNSEGRPVMRPADLVRLGRRFEIGGHTSDHVSLTELSPAAAADQIAANKNRIEDVLGREICGFAYVRGRHNRRVRALVAEAGYRYARTVTNLTAAPGRDRFCVPTTAQFFSHSGGTYIRNYVRRGPTRARSAVLASVLRCKPLAAQLLGAAEACAANGGSFHLWGHSWELDEHDLWDELDRFLGQLRHLGTRFVTNAEWCAQ